MHDDDTAAETDVVPVPVLDNQIQIVKLDVPPSVYALRWSWE